MKYHTYIFAVIFTSNILQAEELTDIQISAPVLENALIKNEAITDINTKNAIDGGDLLKSINGVNTIRRGGHGLDAVIRGQSDQRLNTFLDGAMVYGACSSKMDPATTYANIENYDSISLIKGSQSVMYGAGGPGGIISFERITEPSTTNPLKIKIGQTMESNAETKTSVADIQYTFGQTYLRLNASYSDAGNYATGSGLKPLTEFETNNYAVILGKRLSDGSKLEISYNNNEQEDVGYAGLPMDIVYSYTDIYNLKYHGASPIGPFTNMDIEIFNSDMDHLMDDFTLRARTMMDMFTPAASDTYGGRIIGKINNSFRAGIDYEHNTKDAEQNMEMSNVNYHMTYLWPGVEIEKLGIFLEKDNKLSDTASYTYGVRYDQVEADAKRAGDDPGSNMTQVTANSLYTTHYSTTASKRDFNNFSGFIRFTKKHNPMSNSYISLSRNVRSPDATELFNAKTAMTSTSTNWRKKHIGNPNLKSETHTSLEIGYDGMLLANKINASVFATDVANYITTYRPSNGTYANNSTDARLYKNVDATLWGYELSLKKEFTKNVSGNLNLNYTHGNDDSQNKALAQIMPFSGDITLQYQTSSINYGVRANFADTQDRFDSVVLDSGKTSGYTVYDVFAGIEPSANIRVTMGISNITDKQYVTHLNSSNSLDSGADRLAEPGRSYWLSLFYDF